MAAVGGAGAPWSPACRCCSTGPPSGSTRRPTQPAPQEAAIFDLSFEVTDRFRPVELVAPGFVAVERDQVRAGADDVVLADEGPPAPFAAVEVTLEPGGSAVAGLATAQGDHVLVRWSAASSRLTIEVGRGDRIRVLRRRTVRGPAPTAVAFALCENQVTALVGTGAGWRPVVTERSKVAARVDLRRPEELARHRYAWGGDGARAVRAGIFGMTGLRDPHLVQHADGTPYERDGRIYLTWTCAGLGFFQQAHWTVWSMDPANPTDQRLEAQLFSLRDGLVLGDHAGQLVRDGDRWLLATSSWGDFAPGEMHVRHAETTDDLLTGVHLVETERTPLPTRQGSWDPAITRVDGDWYVGYVESPSQDPFVFHPALARTTSATWHEGLEQVAAATSLRQCEGPVIAAVGQQTWLLASDKDHQCYPVFGLDGHRAGRLDAPYLTNIPHPQPVPAPGGGWWLVTFDGAPYCPRVMGYGGHGDVVVMRST